MSEKIMITKSALTETIRCTICQNSNKTERGCDGSCNYNEEMLSKIIDAIEGIADELPHGEWNYHKEWAIDGECAFECSKCGMGTDVDYNFCPNCGARMKEGEAE